MSDAKGPHVVRSGLPPERPARKTGEFQSPLQLSGDHDLCPGCGEPVALRVDRFDGQQEIYVKSVPELLTPDKLLAGMTVLEDGSPIFLLDLNHLA